MACMYLITDIICTFLRKSSSENEGTINLKLIISYLSYLQDIGDDFVDSVLLY